MSALPKLSRGLTLVRYAVLGTLLQIVLTFVVTIKMFAVSTQHDAQQSIDWYRYLLAFNGLISLAMFIGAASGVPELRRFHLRARSLVISAICFAIATAVLVWAYHTLSAFIDALQDPDVSMEDKLSRAESFKSFPTLAILRSVAYALGLVTLLGSVETAAQDIDQISLRDEAGSMRRALLVMLVGEIFYQYTYGLAGGGIGITGLLASLLVAGFWIYCHVRLARFLYNAAGLINMASEMPMAIVNVEKSEPVARPSQPKPAARPSGPKVASGPRQATAPIVPTPIVPVRPVVPTPIVPAPIVPSPGASAAKPSAPSPGAKPAAPSAPPPIVAVDPRPPAATPAVSNTGAPDDGPKFLR